VDVLASLAESASPAGVLLAASADGKEIGGRLAARLGSGLLVDVVEVKEGAVGVHSIPSVARSPSRPRPPVTPR